MHEEAGALELGIGTGRLALPLASQGIEVHGIDASEAMVKKLRAKPGGQEVAVTIGNFADVSIEGSFDGDLRSRQFFFALVTQEEQVRCFANVATHLARGGAFVIDAFVPDPGLFPQEQRLARHRVDLDEVELIAGRHDSVGQRVRSMQIRLSEDGVRLYPIEIRYAWPAELDLMAQLAGLRLRERVGGWGHEPFTADAKVSREGDALPALSPQAAKAIEARARCARYQSMIEDGWSVQGEVDPKAMNTSGDPRRIGIAARQSF